VPGSGKGDLHDPKYDNSRRSINLTGTQYYNNASAIYRLSLYPTDTLYGVFSTSNPTTAAVGSVLIIIFTSLLFVLYDFFVRKEFTTKDDLLDSKRRFVRFISHEVRTPLNAVCMGLSLVQDDLALALGYKSNDDFVERTENDPHLMEHIELKNEEPPSGDVCLQQRGKNDELIELQKTIATWVTLVQDIRSNAQSSVDVLNDLLNYDKVETDSLSLELTVVSIWNLIEKTANEFLLPAAKKKISFALVFGDIVDNNDEEMSTRLSSQALNLPVEVKRCKIVGDTIRLTQVLRNLISNALKFTQSGGTLTVHASWVRRYDVKEKQRKFVLKNSEEVSVMPCGTLQVKVQDSGAGMSKDQVSQLFQHGVQFNVNDLQAGQGSGLGLYIAKGIVEQHEGRLWAESAGIGFGTTFTISLPMYNIEGMDESTSHDKTGDCSSKSEPAFLRILVVDDAVSNRKLLSRLLTNRGHTVDSAEDGSVALAMVHQAISDGNPYDTILLDYEMPVMNGPSAAKEIRAIGCDVFIVGVTGNMLADDVAYFRSCGANTLLGKPFKIASLEEIWSEYGVTSGTPSFP
jgi:signal transduction histidine kinase/CheY-like chemotaxis protein